MLDISELFWGASVEEMKKGYIFDAAEERFVCLICGSGFTKGVIYRQEETFYEAEKMTGVHIKAQHGSTFDYLIHLNKKMTGLTDLQKNLLTCFREGYSDSEIVKKLDGGSTSTIRHHRFTLREKEKQAKVFLAIMGLLDSGGIPDQRQKFIPVPKTATMVDERYAITEEENEAILKRYFTEGTDGPISEFPKKEKRKVAILKQLIRRFEPERSYTEKEVNNVLKAAFSDYVTLRRYMIEYGFMDRKDDGSAYWVMV